MTATQTVLAAPTAPATAPEHEGRVDVRNAARYPFVPVCTCGEPFRGYVAAHAAQGVIDAHLEAVAARR